MKLQQWYQCISADREICNLTNIFREHIGAATDMVNVKYVKYAGRPAWDISRLERRWYRVIDSLLDRIPSPVGAQIFESKAAGASRRI
jgi:hypothetical protein